MIRKDGANSSTAGGEEQKNSHTARSSRARGSEEQPQEPSGEGPLEQLSLDQSNGPSGPDVAPAAARP